MNVHSVTFSYVLIVFQYSVISTFHKWSVKYQTGTQTDILVKFALIPNLDFNHFRQLEGEHDTFKWKDPITSTGQQSDWLCGLLCETSKEINVKSGKGLANRCYIYDIYLESLILMAVAPGFLQNEKWKDRES